MDADDGAVTTAAAFDGPRANGGGKPSRGKPPFQLCFASAQEQGRSLLSQPKLPINSCIITPKFYSKYGALPDIKDPLVHEIIEEIDSLRTTGPRETYEEPYLESHRYGWYPDPLVPMDKHDRRFHHHRMSSEMVRIQSILQNASRADKHFELHQNRKN